MAEELFVYVSDNPAARWLQLETMYNCHSPRKRVLRGTGRTGHLRPLRNPQQRAAAAEWDLSSVIGEVKS